MTELMMRHVTRKKKGSVVKYECKKGLWSVSGSVDDESSVRSHAETYFIQYFDDGEYD